MSTSPEWMDREYVKARMLASSGSIWACGQCKLTTELVMNKYTGLLECPVHGNDIGATASSHNTRI